MEILYGILVIVGYFVAMFFMMNEHRKLSKELTTEKERLYDEQLRQQQEALMVTRR